MINEREAGSGKHRGRKKRKVSGVNEKEKKTSQ